MASTGTSPVSGEDIGTILWFIRRYVRSERWRLLLIGALLSVSAASTAGLAWLIQPVFDRLVIEQDTSLIWLLPPAIILLVGLNGLALFGKEYMACVVEQNVTTRLQLELFDAILWADLAHRTSRHTGQLIALCTAFTGKLVLALNRFMTGLTGDIILVLCLVAVMFWRDWQIALLAFAAIPIIAIGVRLINNRIGVAAEANMQIEGQIAAKLTDSLGGSKLIKLQGAEASESSRIRELLHTRRRAALELTRVRAASTPVFEFAGGLGIALAVAFAAWRGAMSGPSFGTMASIMGALIMAYRPLKRIAATIATIQESLVVARAIRQQLEIQPTIVDRPGARSLRLQTGAIRFAGVSFGYEAGRLVLDDLNLEFDGGRTTALVGASGSGKTTIANLIPRLYDVQRGAISIDGVDIRDVTVASLRRAIAVVSQETTLFDDTVGANIAFGIPGAAKTDIVAAAQAANVWQFIESLPQGLDTRIGEQGVRLSGGQRQRLAIARAMLKDAPIVILDEATSSVDSESERLIQAAFARLTKGRTVILIAHRLSTVVDADKIYVVSNGGVVETGDHQTMIQARGAYAQLYLLQTLDQDQSGG